MATKTNTLSPARIQLLPRLIRLRDVPFYLGMDKNRFNKTVRPNLIEIPIGDQGIAFDRLEIDHWVDYYIQCNGRPTTPIGEKPWDAKKHQGSPKGASAGTSTKLSKVPDLLGFVDSDDLPRVVNDYEQFRNNQENSNAGLDHSDCR